MAHCETLEWGGHDDWRLPDRYALESIVDAGTAEPAVDTIAFPKTPNDYFWSSSSFADNASRAWFVHFYSGNLSYVGKNSTYYARCVLSGP